MERAVQKTSEAERLKRIRRSEQEYHERCYERNGLFEPGSWLHKPVKTVTDGLKALYTADEVREISVLDLGCGVGRNAIPIAETLNSRGGGTIVCVDLLESALNQLLGYAAERGVDKLIVPVAADIGEYAIPPGRFDYVAAVSALEHLASEEVLNRVLRDIEQSVLPGGAVCFVLNTSARETAIETGESLEPTLELNMTTEEASRILASVYGEAWEIRTSAAKSLTFDIERGGSPVRLDSESLTFYAIKPKIII